MVFFFKQKTAYEVRISGWSSDVCSSDLATDDRGADEAFALRRQLDVHALLDDVDDLLDHKAHSAVPVGEHQNRLTAFGLQLLADVHHDQRHELPTVLPDVPAVREIGRASCRERGGQSRLMSGGLRVI